MFKSFLVSMFAIFLFALGATGSWFYLNMDTAKEADEDGLPMTPVVADTAADPFPGLLPTAPELPAVVRGPALGPEELFRIEAAVEQQKEQLREQQELLQKQQARMKVTDADTKAAQREVEGALNQVRNLMDSAEKLLDDVKLAMENLQQQKEEVRQQAEELQALQNETGANARTSIKTIAEYVQSMPPETAADMLKEMINDGKMDFAIQIIRNVEPRNVAKILAEFDDRQLLAELMARHPEAPVLR